MEATLMNDYLDPRKYQKPVSRRRVLVIAGATLGAYFIPSPASDAFGKVPQDASRTHRWHGQVLCAHATILLQGMDPVPAERLVRKCLVEVMRLENIFSLYLPDSELSHLNRDGELRAASPELVELLSEAIRFGHVTSGAFDVTIQALWNLYEGHFSQANPDPAGPSQIARAEVLKRVDYTAIELERRHVALARPGMAVTLNGIAQGYITDRITRLLRDNGVNSVLVDLGEMRALGRHSSGRPWTIGVVNPNQPKSLMRKVSIIDQAVASSGGYGTKFDIAGRHHHLFDRSTGASAKYTLGVTVVAPTATIADALSTALSVMPYDQALSCLNRFDRSEAMITMLDGSVVTIRGTRRVD